MLQVLFTPATQAARQAACTIVEALTTIPSRKQQVLDLLTRYEPQTENQQVKQSQDKSIITNINKKENMVCDSPTVDLTWCKFVLTVCVHQLSG